MATQLQIRRGTSSQVAAFTGAEGEIVVNTTNDSVHVNDGSTAGGFELARADLNNVSDTSLNAALTGNTVSALTITTLTLGSTAITATGAEINILDGVTATAAELNILDGVTSTTAELNILDGVTSTAAELNILDGVTATTAELNHVDGVTSAIQTQLDAKAPLASPTFTGTVTVPGLTTTADISFADNDKAIFGAGSDLQIYHDGGNSVIRDTGTGGLFVMGSSNVYITNNGASANFFAATEGAEVTLYHNNSAKLATTSTGIDVTGAVTADDLIKVQNAAGSAAAEVDIVSGGTWRLRSNPTSGTNNYGFDIVKGSAGTDVKFSIDQNGNTSFTLGTNAKGTFGDAISEVGSGNFALQVTNSAGSALKPLGFRAEDIRFATGSTEVFRLTSAQDMYFGQTSGSAADVGIILQSTGNIFNTVSGGPCAFLRRNTSDGEIIRLSINASTIGTISGHNGDLHIGTGACGVRFLDGDPSLSPYNPTSGANADNTIQLGRSNVRFDDAFITNGVTTGSDRDLKQDIEALSAAEKRVAVAAKALLRKYRWKDAVAEKGDDARIHFGIIAQDLQDAFTAEGLDASRYGMWCSDTWTNEDGSEQTRLSIRYSELLAFIIAAI